MDGGLVGALVGSLVTAATAVTGAVIYFMRERAKLNSADRIQTSQEEKDAFAHLSIITDRQEKHIQRQAEQIEKLQVGYGRLYGALADCREAEGTMYGHLQYMHEVNMRHAAALRALGQNVEDPLPLPPRPERIRLHEDFEVRTLTQDTALLKEVTRSITTNKQKEPPQ
jgi:hypothetical protein